MELDEVRIVDEVLPELLLPPGDCCKIPNFRNSVNSLGIPKKFQNVPNAKDEFLKLGKSPVLCCPH
jgi:hypothetical protein